MRKAEKEMEIKQGYRLTENSFKSKIMSSDTTLHPFSIDDTGRNINSE